VTAEIVVVKEAKEMMDEREEKDVIGMERKQMILGVLVLPLLPEQKRGGRTKKH